MSQFSDVDTNVSDGIQTISFYHPKGNSLSGDTLRKLKDVILDASEATNVKVVVLSSAGEQTFCGGASFDELLIVKTPEQGKEFFMGFARLILAMRQCSKIIVSRVQGKVVGGGVGIVAASDYVIGTTLASLRLSELALGLGPFVVGPAIERRIGHSAYMAMALDAEWRDAVWARDHGLYAHIYESVQELDNGLALAVKHLSRMSPAALRELKSVFWQGTESWERLLPERAEISGRLALSPEAQQLIHAAARAG